MNVNKVVKELSNLYGFNYTEALILIDHDKSFNTGTNIKKYKDVTDINKKDFEIKPFDGIVRQECCKAVIYNHGLYTQCMNITDKDFCSSLCKRQKYGNINIRKDYPVGTYILANGKKEINYQKVKKRLSKHKSNNIFDIQKRIVTEDSDTGDDEYIGLDVDKKCRGRPKMAIKEVEVKIDSTENPRDYREGLEEVLVRRQLINEKEYLLSDNNILYDSKTYRIIGKYLLGRIIDIDDI